MATITSIYIPRMLSCFTEEQVKRVFYNLYIGQVCRVDFTPIGKKEGFTEDVFAQVKSAFVHFDHFYQSVIAKRVLEKLSKDEEYKLSIDHHHYWLLFKTINPVQKTMMNNAQIVENCRFLENKVEEQAEIIKNLEKKIDNTQEVLYQLLGGLFSHESQSSILQNHMNILHGDKPLIERHDTSKWGLYPTTRQGDSNESRIDALESQMAAAGELLYNLTNKEIEVYEPLRNEVCDFKYYYDDYQQVEDEDDEQDDDDIYYEDDDTLVTIASSNDSLPKLEPIYGKFYNGEEIYNSGSGSDSSIVKRRINSFELCGNE